MYYIKSQNIGKDTLQNILSVCSSTIYKEIKSYSTFLQQLQNDDGLFPVIFYLPIRYFRLVCFHLFPQLFVVRKQEPVEQDRFFFFSFLYCTTFYGFIVP